MYKYFFIAVLSLMTLQIKAQSYIWGIKGGLSIGTQKWAYFTSRNALFKFHGDIFIETWSDEDKYSIGSQIGYHPRGSAIRYLNYSTGSGLFNNSSINYIFNNLVLAPYAKQKFTFSETLKGYYALGFRLEYTFNTNLQNGAELYKNGYFFYSPIKDYVRKWNFGPILMGGLQFKYSELVGGSLEFSVSPDISRQYYQPPVNNVITIDPFTGSPTTTNFPEQTIRNVSFEISFGFRFLRKIEYID